MAVGTSLRWGELSALQVRDAVLDGPAPQLHVRRAWKRNGTGDYARADLGRFYLGRPKTKKSRHRVTLSPTVVESLRRAIGDRRGEQYVFTAPRGGPLDQGCFYERRWQRAVRGAQEHGLAKVPTVP